MNDQNDFDAVVKGNPKLHFILCPHYQEKPQIQRDGRLINLIDTRENVTILALCSTCRHVVTSSLVADIVRQIQNPVPIPDAATERNGK